MLTLIRNARVFTPHDLGVTDVVVADKRIAAVGEDLNLSGSCVASIDTGGRWLVPGFVDVLTHPCGGGGEEGFGNRTAEVPLESFVQAGVTCPIGALGTDSLGRSLDVLYASVMSLRARGLSGYLYNGSYRLPADTFTGDVARDLVLIEPVIGTGEVAIADHRGSQVSAEELRRLAADVRLGATIAGKRGVVLIHVGAGDSRLQLLRDALADTDLSPDCFLPTHVNRTAELLDEAIAFCRSGAWIDLTVSSTPEFIEQGEVPALEGLFQAIDNGAAPQRLTLSSDAGGSLPLYEAGELKGLQQAGPQALRALFHQAIRQYPTRIAEVLAALTRNPADALGLTAKGRIEVGADADLLLLDPDSGEIDSLMCGGQWLKYQGQLNCPTIPIQ